jgi:hypothetical protein
LGQFCPDEAARTLAVFQPSPVVRESQLQAVEDLSHTPITVGWIVNKRHFH